MIQWFKPNFWGNEKQYVQDALDSTWLSDGEYIKKFERTFGNCLHIDHAITVSNGTTALYLALLSLSIGSGDEVIIPGYTFAAPANMVLAAGATPVFAEVDPDTWLLSPKAFASGITNNTKAVIPVHIYGNVCDMDAIKKIAKQYNIAVIEDVAEATFSKYSEQYAGTFGDFGCFSFQSTKTLTMGEGGCVIANNSVLADRARLIRNHGMRPAKRYWHEVVGHNFRLTNYQAALGYGQLEKIDEIIKNKKRVYNAYKEKLIGVDGITLQHIANNTDPVMWAVALKLECKYFKGDRDFIINALYADGIETRTGFYGFDAMPLYDVKNLLVSGNISQNVISLPSYAMLENDKIDYVCEKLLALRK